MIVTDSYEEIELKARQHMSAGEYQEALEGYQRLSERLDNLTPVVLERRPELSELLVLSLAQQAYIHHWLGEYENAIELCQRLIDLKPSRANDWRRLMAMAQIDLGQGDEGIDTLMAQSVATPGNYDLWLTLGLECQNLGRTEEAEENLKRAVMNAVAPQDKTECGLALFDFYREQGQVDKALEAWDEAWSSQAQAAYVFPLYQMMLENDDLERASQFLEDEPNPLRKRFYQGVVAEHQGDHEQALKLWKRATRIDPLKYTEGHESWAEAALRTGMPELAVVTTLQSVNRVDMANHRGLLMQAIAEARMGHLDKSSDVLETLNQLGASSRPRQEKLAEVDWDLFDELVPDEEIKKQLRHFFETESSEEGSPS